MTTTQKAKVIKNYTKGDKKLYKNIKGDKKLYFFQKKQGDEKLYFQVTFFLTFLTFGGMIFMNYYSLYKKKKEHQMMFLLFFVNFLRFFISQALPINASTLIKAYHLL